MQFIQISSLIATVAVVWFFVEPTQFNAFFLHLIILLSILGAAVLFRLGRGFPQLEVRYLDNEDIEKYCQAYQIASERMKVLFYVIIFTILLIILYGYIYEESEMNILNRIFVSVILGTVLFVLFRTWELVKFDVDLIRLQADLVKKSIRSERVNEEIERIEKDRSKNPIETPVGYGGKTKLEQITSRIFNNTIK